MTPPLNIFTLNVYHPRRDVPSFPTRRSSDLSRRQPWEERVDPSRPATGSERIASACDALRPCRGTTWIRSEEHTSELQSRGQLVCRLLLAKKKKKTD